MIDDVACDQRREEPSPTPLPLLPPLNPPCLAPSPAWLEKRGSASALPVGSDAEPRACGRDSTGTGGGVCGMLPAGGARGGGSVGFPPAVLGRLDASIGVLFELCIADRRSAVTGRMLETCIPSAPCRRSNVKAGAIAIASAARPLCDARACVPRA